MVPRSRAAWGMLCWIAFCAALAMAWGTSLPPRHDLWGWPRVTIVHLLCAIPLGVCLAELSKSERGRRRTSVVLAMGAVALGVCLARWALAREHAALFWPAHLARTALAVGVALLTVAVIMRLLDPRKPGAADSSSAQRGPRLNVCFGLLAAGLALGLPLLYVLDVTRRQTLSAEGAILGGRFAEADDTLRRLMAVGSPFPVGGMPLERAADAAAQRHRELAVRVAVGLGPAASPEARLAHAEDLLALGNLPAALQTVAPIVEGFAPAALLAGHVLQRQGEWQDSSRRYRDALRLLDSAPAAETLAVQVRTFDAIAFNLRELGRFEEALAIYVEAGARLPAAAAHFHFQRGLHLQRYADRPAAAGQAFALALALDPTLSERLTQAREEALFPAGGACGWIPGLTRGGY